MYNRIGRNHIAARLAHAVAVGTEYHALMHQPPERLVKADKARVVQKLCDKPRIQQVTARVLRAADVAIDGQQFVYCFSVERGFIVVRVGIAQEVPGRANEGIERIGLASRGLAALGTDRIDELIASCERRLAVGRKIDVVRQFDGQLALGHGHGAAAVAVYDGYWRAPIPLTRYGPIAHAVVYLLPAAPELFKLLYDGKLALAAFHTVEPAAVRHHAVFGKRKLAAAVLGHDDALYGKPVLFGELVVARVVRRNAHHCARAVSGKAVIGDVYGRFFAVYRVNAITPRKYARLFLCGRRALDLAALCRLGDVLFDSGALLCDRKFFDHRMLGRDNYVAHAEQRIGARRKYRYLLRAVGPDYLEVDLAADGLTYPVALHRLGLFGPIEPVQPVQQFFRIVGYLKEPLRQLLVHDLGLAPLALAVDDLLVGDNGLTRRTVIDGRFLLIRESVLVKLQKQPLRPLVVIGRARAELVRPVEHYPHLFELTLHGRNVRIGGILGMYARLYRIVLRGQTEGVEPHRLKNVLAVHAHEPREAVGNAVIVPMPDMQLRTRRVRQHFETVKLIAAALKVVCSVALPNVAPFLFYTDVIHKNSDDKLFQNSLDTPYARRARLLLDYAKMPELARTRRVRSAAYLLGELAHGVDLDLFAVL